jgi:hypothetical protein
MFIAASFLMLAEASSDSWGIKILVGVVAGVVATFLGFLLNQYHQDSKETIKETKEYIASLQSAANELEFYTGKLQQLSSELEALEKRLEAWKTNWVIPTYSIYPDFLEKCKITISAFHKNPKLVKEVGHCHFELCHILARLDFLKKEMNTTMEGSATDITRELNTRRINCGGFKALVDENIPVFKATREEILSEKVKMDRELQVQKERSLLLVRE